MTEESVDTQLSLLVSSQELEGICDVGRCRPRAAGNDGLHECAELITVSVVR